MSRPSVDDVERHLLQLIGLPLWAAGRAADLLWLQFGDRVPAPTPLKPDRVAGEFALHLQCPWRMALSESVLMSSDDLYVPADPDVAVGEFDWKTGRHSLLDRRLSDFTERFRGPLALSVDIDRGGGFRMLLEDNLVLEVIPADSGPPVEEAWRLLRPGREDDHFVVGWAGPDPE